MTIPNANDPRARAVEVAGLLPPARHATPGTTADADGGFLDMLTILQGSFVQLGGAPTPY